MLSQMLNKYQNVTLCHYVWATFIPCTNPYYCTMNESTISHWMTGRISCCKTVRHSENYTQYLHGFQNNGQSQSVLQTDLQDTEIVCSAFCLIFQEW